MVTRITAKQIQTKNSSLITGLLMPQYMIQGQGLGMLTNKDKDQKLYADGAYNMEPFAEAARMANLFRYTLYEKSFKSLCTPVCPPVDTGG